MANQRLCRALIRSVEHIRQVNDPVIQASVRTLQRAGQAIDFAARLQGHGLLSANLVTSFATFSGLDASDLRLWVLPSLEAVGIIDFEYEDGQLDYVEERVGVSASVLEQLGGLLEHLGPRDEERCVLHSIALGSWAPLVERQHLDILVRTGFSDSVARNGLQLSRALRVNSLLWSDRLRENVVYNAYVWGAGHVEMAGFLRTLPSTEREMILGICEEASNRPGIALPGMSAFDPEIIVSARKVGLIQGARVISSRSTASEQLYLFSPMMDIEDNHLRTTEALNLRKMFIAHILYGHEMAERSGGRIVDPVLLVSALLRNGMVGPASNIRTDYKLLETHGIVHVDETRTGPMLRLVQKEIVQDSLSILERTLGSASQGAASSTPLDSLRPPGKFYSPERDRLFIPDEAAASEVTGAAILRLREEAQRAVRHEDPFED